MSHGKLFEADQQPTLCKEANTSLIVEPLSREMIALKKRSISDSDKELLR